MKKLIFALGLLICFTAASHAQAITNTNAYPFGTITTKTLTATKSADTVAVKNNVTYVIISDTMHAAMSIVAVPATRLKAGAILYVKLSWGAIIRTVTFSSGYFTSTTATGTANKTQLCTFVYDGSKFINIAKTLDN